MLRSRLQRVGFLIAILGAATVLLSFFTWSAARSDNGLYYSIESYDWVRSDRSSAPALRIGEVWRLSGECLRPFYLQNAAKAEKESKAYAETIPTEYAEYLRSPPKGSDYEVTLQALEMRRKYGSWDIQKSILEHKVKDWQWRADNVKSEDISDVKQDILLAAKPEAIASELGFSLLPKEDIQKVAQTCVERVTVKQIISDVEYHTRLPRWPLEQPFPFALGVILLAGGVLLAPLYTWVRAGSA